jgi:phosphoribosylanthranilate isomerase
VKICGNRSRSDVDASREADYIGFIIEVSDSRRSVTVDEAKPLFKRASDYAKTVAVIRSPDAELLKRIDSFLRPDYIQVHTLLSGGEISRLRNVTSSGLICLIAPDRNRIDEAADAASASDMVIADTFKGGASGGTGSVHDWNATALIREKIHPARLILSGGLNEENVAEAVLKVRPAAVDVSSGVESGGVKSVDLIRRFIAKARENDDV